MLNYAYAVKLAKAQIEAIADGYDLTIGIMHNSKWGSHAWALDMIELERSAVDARILQFVRDHTFAPADFIPRKDGVPCFETNPSLLDVYRKIEADCEPTEALTPEDEWTNLANWSFHQALWSIAERSEEGRLNRDQVTFQMFDNCMKRNLSADDCWISERVEYEASP